MQGRAANQPAPLTGQDTGRALGYGCHDVPITETHGKCRMELGLHLLPWSDGQQVVGSRLEVYNSLSHLQVVLSLVWSLCLESVVVNKLDF